MRNYITAQRAHQWGVDVSDEQLCESASAMIDHLTKGAIYRTDPDGYPLGDLRDVFDAAACAQAAWQATNGTSSADALAQGGSFMSLSLPGTGARSTGDVMASRVAPGAYEILSAHNLLFNAPAAGGWRW